MPLNTEAYDYGFRGLLDWVSMNCVGLPLRAATFLRTDPVKAMFLATRRAARSRVSAHTTTTTKRSFMRTVLWPLDSAASCASSSGQYRRRAGAEPARGGLSSPDSDFGTRAMAAGGPSARAKCPCPTAHTSCCHNVYRGHTHAWHANLQHAWLTRPTDTCARICVEYWAFPGASRS